MEQLKSSLYKQGGASYLGSTFEQLPGVRIRKHPSRSKRGSIDSGCIQETATTKESSKERAKPILPAELSPVRTDLERHLDRVGSKLKQLDFISSASVKILSNHIKNISKKTAFASVTMGEIAQQRAVVQKRTSKLFSLYQSRQYQRKEAKKTVEGTHLDSIDEVVPVQANKGKFTTCLHYYKRNLTPLREGHGQCNERTPYTANFEKFQGRLISQNFKKEMISCLENQFKGSSTSVKCITSQDHGNRVASRILQTYFAIEDLEKRKRSETLPPPLMCEGIEARRNTSFERCHNMKSFQRPKNMPKNTPLIKSLAQNQLEIVRSEHLQWAGRMKREQNLQELMGPRSPSNVIIEEVKFLENTTELPKIEKVPQIFIEEEFSSTQAVKQRVQKEMLVKTSRIIENGAAKQKKNLVIPQTCINFNKVSKNGSTGVASRVAQPSGMQMKSRQGPIKMGFLVPADPIMYKSELPQGSLKINNPSFNHSESRSISPFCPGGQEAFRNLDRSIISNIGNSVDSMVSLKIPKDENSPRFCLDKIVSDESAFSPDTKMRVDQSKQVISQRNSNNKSALQNRESFTQMLNDPIVSTNVLPKRVPKMLLSQRKDNGAINRVVLDVINQSQANQQQRTENKTRLLSAKNHQVTSFQQQRYSKPHIGTVMNSSIVSTTDISLPDRYKTSSQPPIPPPHLRGQFQNPLQSRGTLVNPTKQQATSQSRVIQNTKLDQSLTELRINQAPPPAVITSRYHQYGTLNIIQFQNELITHKHNQRRHEKLRSEIGSSYHSELYLRTDYNQAVLWLRQLFSLIHHKYTINYLISAKQNSITQGRIFAITSSLNNRNNRQSKISPRGTTTVQQ